MNTLGNLKHLTLFAFISLTLSVGPSASANVGEAYGFGSAQAALGGATIGADPNAYSAYTNPAALAKKAASNFEVSWSLIDMVSQFLPIENVVVENGFTSDRLTIGNVDTKYRATFGHVLGARWSVFPEWANLSVGAVAFVPAEQIGYLDTGENFIPEYALYRARTQRPQVELGTAFQPTSWLNIGAGLHFGFSLTSNATVFLQTLKDKPSTMRFAASIQPKASPYFGVLVAPRDGMISWGTVVRFPLTASNTMALKSGARALGSYASLDFNFTSTSVMLYDPLTVENGFMVEYLKGAKLFLQGEFQAWSKYAASSLVIQSPSVENCGGTSCGLPLSAGVAPQLALQDIWVWRVGHEFGLGSWKWRAGYSYRPSILSQVSFQKGNILDPPKHQYQIGVGYAFTKITVDVYGGFHQLVTQKITKEPGDENGAGAGDLKIGAPGYSAGGKVYGGGASVTLSL